MFKHISLIGGAGTVALLTACAPAPVPTPISVEPSFNKYGVPSCRPADMPVGGIYTADLPLCAVITNGTTIVDTDGTDIIDSDDDGIPDDIDDDTPDDTTGGNQNQNQNQNTNQNTNQNQSG